jgi:hypothetical protein
VAGCAACGGSTQRARTRCASGGRWQIFGVALLPSDEPRQFGNLGALGASDCGRTVLPRKESDAAER